MFLNTKKIFSAVLVGTFIVGMSYQSTALAAASDRFLNGVEGKVSCGGNYFTRNGGEELHRSNYILRNYSSRGSIYLDRIRVYNAKGTVLFDSDVSGIPTFRNNIINANDTELDPNQTAALRIVDMIPRQGRFARPLQTVFNWSADFPTTALDVGNVRTVTSVDPVSGAVGKQRARHFSACRTIHLRRRN